MKTIILERGKCGELSVFKTETFKYDSSGRLVESDLKSNEHPWHQMLVLVRATIRHSTSIVRRTVE